MSKMSERVAFALQQLEAHGIEHSLKNTNTGHIHCRRKSDDKLYQYYAGTGKIVGEEAKGIFALIDILEGKNGQ